MNWSDTGRPWHEIVPRSINENRKFRSELLRLASDNRSLQRLLKAICKKDILFYVNAFVWTFQPRDRTRPNVRPMITWPEQEDVILEVHNAIFIKEFHPKINIKKSREQGGTWLVLCVCDHLCRFYIKETALIASSDQKLVDSIGREDSGDSDTLFSKLDFLQEYLPDWLKCLRLDRSRKKNHVSYVTTSKINGIPTTLNLGRGGRRTIGLLDEAASMQGQSDIDKAVSKAWHVRVKVSTPNGFNSQFKRDERLPGVIFKTLHWRNNPQHNRGLYRPNPDGTLEYLDKEYWTKERIDAYDFKKYISTWPTSNPIFPERSPSYDYECETTSASDVRENLDINDQGKSMRFFLQDAGMIKDFERVRANCRPPICTGILEYDHATGDYKKFKITATKTKVVFNLWIEVGTGGRPPQDRNYGMGIDISQGTGYSNSTISIIDFRLRQKIGEVISSHTKPEDWEVLCVAVARWLGGLSGEAQMIWGKQGPGQHFSKAIYDLGHRSVYCRNDKAWNQGWNKEPGVSEDDKTKLSMFTEYRSVLYSNHFDNPSVDAIDELTHFIYNENGFVAHDEVSEADDASDAKHNHGDRVTSDVLGSVMLGPTPKIEDEPQENFAVQGTANPFSYAGRRRMYEDEKNRELAW